jgi:Mor family transcriptional regulator
MVTNMVSQDRPEDVPAAWQWLLDEDLVPADALPEDIALMIDLAGRPAVARLLATFAGIQVYFPSLKQSCARYRAARILKEFDGTNQRVLARRYGLSERRVYELLKHPPAGRK